MDENKPRLIDDEAERKLEAVRAKCAMIHALRLNDYEQGRQDLANEVLDILDGPASAPPPRNAPLPLTLGAAELRWGLNAPAGDES